MSSQQPVYFVEQSQSRTTAYNFIDAVDEKLKDSLVTTRRENPGQISDATFEHSPWGNTLSSTAQSTTA